MLIDGKMYSAHIISTKYKKEEKHEKSSSTSGRSCEKWGAECEGDIFNGCILRTIKLDLVEGEYEVFPNTRELLKSLTNGSQMLNTPLPVNRERYQEEKRNVMIQEAYLFMISKELDNDYHLILGNDPDHRKSVLFSAEISALNINEDHEDYVTLKMVREKFKKLIGVPKSCNATKRFTTDLTENPIRIMIKGSVLFDNQHKHGGSGYGNVKTKTAWEIHPVSDFEVL